ncbi:MAG: NAD(+) synthase [Verrucomicrobiales bacterium]|nr:NAD(+) synthase [Verrucomicrobiales bacterium]
MSLPPLSPRCLDLDAEKAVDTIAVGLRTALTRRLRKRGLVIGLSGGIDSSVVAALAARILGPRNVLGLLMPERESAPETLGLGRSVAEHLGVPWIHEDISPILDAAGCYRRRDQAISRLVPDYTPDCLTKIVLPGVIADDRYRLFQLVVRYPDGRQSEVRLDLEAYLGIVASTNFKQRTRKMLEYYHADRLNYAVAGTPNRLEYDQGFFVKLGDGAADIKPIAHLYKSQVYALARFLGLPEAIRSRPPTTDTYSLPQSQEEFYFSLPYADMDLALYAFDHGYPAEALAEALRLTTDQASRIYRDIVGKRRMAETLHAAPILVEPASA